MRTRRLFVALWPPDEVVRAVAQWRDECQRMLPRGLARYVPDHQLHLTVQFLGEVPEDRIPDLASALLEHGGWPADFELLLGRPGIFPSAGRPRVLWLGLEGDGSSLLRLESVVVETVAPYLRDAPRRAATFHPHLTLARFRDLDRSAARQISEGVDHLGRVRRPRVEWRIRGIRLMRSDLGPAGPRYEIEAEIPLDRTVNPGGVGDG